MFERMSWSSAYELWKHSRYFFPKSLFEAPAAESVFVDYNQENYIYSYDWLSNEEMEERKRLINRFFIVFQKKRPKDYIGIVTATREASKHFIMIEYGFQLPKV